MKKTLLILILLVLRLSAVADTIPIITNQPASQVVAVGTGVGFSVGVSNAPPLSYQWLLNNAAIAGATGSSFSNSFVQVSELGSYSVVVTNSAGSVTSSNAILTTTCSPAPPNLIAWWQAESNAMDYVGSYNGTVSNGVSYITGRVGKAFKFDGTTNASITCGTNVGNFGTNNFTVEFWINTSSINPEEAVMEKRDVCYLGYFWNIRIGGGSGISAGMLAAEVDDGTAESSLLSSNLVNNGVWHHAAFVRSGLALSFYIDGALTATTTALKVYNIHNSVDFRLGQSICQSHDSTQPFSGALDEISLYNRALSSNEIAAIYAGGGKWQMLH